MKTLRRVLLIGLDGASPDLVKHWIGEGRLPHLAAFARHGTLGPLAGVTPPVTYPAWTSCVTGVNPGRHGIPDFTIMRPDRYGIRFLNSTDREAPALWNILSEAGRRVCVLGVPATYPPEPVNGILMAGFDSPVADRIDPSFVYPWEAYGQVAAWRFSEFQEHRITPRWYGSALAALEHKIDVQEKIACTLLRQEPWDFFMVVLGEADTVSHHFWPLEDASSPRRNPRSSGPEHPIRRIYERLDRTVGALAAAFGGEGLALVVSDHGFGGASAQTLHINNFLAEQGWLCYGRNQSGLLKKAVLRWAPVRGRGRLFRRFQRAAESVESRSRFGGIDWRFTRAWSDELDYCPSVRLNLEGREPAGTVPAARYAETVGELCRLLETLPGVTRAFPRDAVYTGPYIDRAADIFLELDWSTGYRLSLIRRRGGPVVEDIPPDRYAGGKEAGCSGVHRNPALLAANQPLRGENPSLLDIAPTVLATLGVDFSGMEGASLLPDAAGKGNAIPGKWTKAPAMAYTEEEQALLEKRMQALGYFE